MNKLFLSTGAFTGRINGRNPHLLTEYFDKINCDGFELLLFDDLYEDLDAVINEYRCKKINISVVHFDKRIGDMLSSGEISGACSLYEANCKTAIALGAKIAVVHIWGIPESDKNFTGITKGVGKLLEISSAYNIDMLAENCFCNHSPLSHISELSEIYPGLGFIIDTRCAQFHGELLETLESPVFDRSVRHIHINDYKGGYMDWSAMYPIYQPGCGDIDWQMFFGKLNNKGYKGSITLEAPSMLENSVDSETFNKSLEFIRANLK